MRFCQCCNSLANTNYINNINITIVDEINLNNELIIKYCSNCYFYFIESNNKQEDYDNYYLNYNNYRNYILSNDKDIECSIYLKNNLDKNVKTILDYGCGNKILSEYLNSTYDVDNYDIGMDHIDKKYDCLVLSHVLEHIYDIKPFIENLKKYITNDGYLYIEVPNMEYYKEFINFGPLQEISLEHINFFSKYALSKLMINNNFIPIKIEDCYFHINENKYYIIRGIFKINNNNNSFETYLNNGFNIINNINIKSKNIYIYGCGQLLFKIFDKLNNENSIINIIDDNSSYLLKKIKNIEIINFEMYKKISNDNDNILIVTLNYKDNIKNKLLSIGKKINIYEI